MKITEEISITEFTPWSGAVSTKERIIEEGKVDEFDSLIEEVYPDGLTSTELNDLLWFDSDWIYEMIGISEEDDDEDDDDEELEDLLDEELKDSNKKKVKDNEEILTNEEKEYLKKEIDHIVDKNIYTPLFYKISSLELNVNPNLNYNIMSINFEKSTLGDAGVSQICFEVDQNLFKGMKPNKQYTLEELGINEEHQIKDNKEEYEIDYNKEFDLTNEEELNNLANAASLWDIKFNDDLFHASELFKIPYEDVEVSVLSWYHSLGWYYDDGKIDFDFEILGVDLADYFDEDASKKYILELAGSDKVITPAELVKRSTTEKIIKFVKENNLIPKDTIEEAAQEVADDDNEDTKSYYGIK